MKSEASSNLKQCKVLRLSKSRYPSTVNSDDWDDFSSESNPITFEKELLRITNENHNLPMPHSKLTKRSNEIRNLNEQTIKELQSIPKLTLGSFVRDPFQSDYQNLHTPTALHARSEENPNMKNGSSIFDKRSNSTVFHDVTIPDFSNAPGRFNMNRVDFLRTAGGPNVSTTFTNPKIAEKSETNDMFYRPPTSMTSKNLFMTNSLGVSNTKPKASSNSTVKHHINSSDIGFDIKNKAPMNNHSECNWEYGNQQEKENGNSPGKTSYNQSFRTPLQKFEVPESKGAAPSIANFSHPIKICAKTEAHKLNKVLDTLTQYKEQNIHRPALALVNKPLNHSEPIQNTNLAMDQKYNPSSKENIPQLKMNESETKSSKTAKQNIQQPSPKVGVKLFEGPKIRAGIVNSNKSKENEIVKDADLLENYSSNFEESPVRVNPIRTFKRTNLEGKNKEDESQKVLTDSTTRTLSMSESVNEEVINEENMLSREKLPPKKRLFLKKTSISLVKPAEITNLFKFKELTSKSEKKEAHKKIGIKIRTGRSYEECLAEYSVFKTITDFLCMKSLCLITRVCKRFRSLDLLDIVKKAQCKLIMKGLTEKEQYEFWDLHANFGYLHKTYPLQFASNALKPSKYERDIMSDLDRTRFFNESSASKQDSLHKLLVALSNGVPKIGYVQGLNAIAAALLATNLRDSEAYWLIRYIMAKKRFEEILADGFPRVQVLNYQLDIYAQNYIPELAKYLGDKGLNISYFSTQWFITIFSYDLELSHLLKVWNFFFVKGWKVLIRVALSLLWHFKSQICERTSDELPEFLKSCIREYILQIPEEELFKVAFSFKVSNRLLKGLEILYEHSAPPNVVLTPNKNHSLEWKILCENSPGLNPSIVQKDIIEYLNENLDRMKNVNRMRGDAHNELDNYRSVQLESGTCSLVVEKVHSATLKDRQRLDASNEFKKFAKPLKSRFNNQRMSDSNFLQTLSDFGKRIRQILTPKDDLLDFSQSEKLTDTKTDPEQKGKEGGTEKTAPQLSERNDFRSMSTSLPKLSPKTMEAEDQAELDTQHFLPNLLKVSTPKTLLDSIQPFSPLSFKEEQNFDFDITTPTTNLFAKVETDILHAPKKIIKHKKNISLTHQDLAKNVKNSQQTANSLNTLPTENSSRTETNQSKTLKSNRQENLETEEPATKIDLRERSRGIFLNKAGRGNRESRYSRLEHSQTQSEFNAVNYSNLSTDVFEYKESRKLPSKTGVDDFDFSEGL